MDAIQLLLSEHNRFRKIFSEITKNLTARNKNKFEMLCRDLIRHETMEQKVWYPKLKKDKKCAKVIKHLVSEEKEAAKEIKKIEKIKTPEKWKEKFLKLKEAVDHHANEEETSLFPIVEYGFDESELKKLSQEMRAFKRKYKPK